MVVHLAMFLKFSQIIPEKSRTFSAKKQNSHMTNIGSGISLQVGKVTGSA